MSATIDQKTYLKNLGGASAPLAPPWIRLWLEQAVESASNKDNERCREDKRLKKVHCEQAQELMDQAQEPLLLKGCSFLRLSHMFSILIHVITLTRCFTALWIFVQFFNEFVQLFLTRTICHKGNSPSSSSRC